MLPSPTTVFEAKSYLSPQKSVAGMLSAEAQKTFEHNQNLYQDMEVAFIYRSL